MTQLSISEARKKLTQLADQVNDQQETIEVTNHGKPVLAILSWDLYEALEETVEILGDEDLRRQLSKSIEQMKQGKLIPWDQVRKNLHLK